MRGSRALKRSDLAPRDLARFWSQVEVHGRSYGRRGRCWPWRGHAEHKGYGVINLKGRLEQAHRVAFAALFGEAPADASIRHSCDNRLCCQGGHLISGTNLENVWDRVSRGRSNSSPLTPQEVSELRRLVAAGTTQAQVARRYGISQSSVSHIINRKTWRHLP